MTEQNEGPWAIRRTQRRLEHQLIIKESINLCICSQRLSPCFQLQDDFRSALFNIALMLTNDLKKPLDALPYLRKLLKVGMVPLSLFYI